MNSTSFTKHLLSAERASLGQSSLATSWLAEDSGAGAADDGGLGVREDGGDGEASWALDVHEEGTWSWDESLQLVLLELGGWGGVQKIESENHFEEIESLC